MNAVSPTQILCPLISASHDRSAFSVARVMARAARASLHVVAAGVQALSVQDLARRLSVAEEELDAVTIEEASGDLVDAMLRKVKASKRAILILAARLADEAPAPMAEPYQALVRKMLEQISCPVLMVPPDIDMSAWQLRRVLLPQDGTPGCAGALGQVIDQYSRMGAENLILRVAGANIGQPTEPGSLATPRYVDHPQYEWESWSREFLDRICGECSNLDPAGLRLLMATGEPAAEILRVAQEEAADMIILPWHGALGSGRGRMVKAVLRGAPCPVMLLPKRRND